MEERLRQAVRRACAAAGGVTELANALGVTSQAVSMWHTRGQIPVTRCADVSRVTGLSLSELRPDVFGEVEQ